MKKEIKDFTIDITNPPIDVLGKFEPVPMFDPDRTVLIDGKEVEGIPGKLLLAFVDVMGLHNMREVFKHMKDNNFLEKL